MNDETAKLIQQGAEEAWQRFCALAPTEQRTPEFEECFRAGFLAGVTWTYDELFCTPQHGGQPS